MEILYTILYIFVLSNFATPHSISIVIAVCVKSKMIKLGK